MDLAAWTAKLLVTAALLGGFPPARRAPPVAIVSAAALAARFCGGACRPRGAYLADEGVLLADGLDLDGNPRDRSVLLHELVHYLQDINARYAAEPDCDRWRDREIQAYDVQERYLNRYNMGAGNVAAALEVEPAACWVRPPEAPRDVMLFHDPPR